MASAAGRADGGSARRASRLRRRASQSRRRPRSRSQQQGRNILGARPSPPHIIAFLSQFTCVASNDRRPGLRVAVHAAHRAPPAGTVGVLGGGPVQHAARGAAGPAAGRHHPVGRSQERVGRRRATLRRGRRGRRRAGARHLLRHAAADEHARRQRAALGAPGVRPRARAGARRGRRAAPLPGAAPAFRVWASHGDDVAAVPPGFRRRPPAPRAPIVAMEAPDRALYGLLFHPEVVHTEHGAEILRRFAFDVCGCTGDWTIASFIEEATSRIRTQVGDDGQGRLWARRAAWIRRSPRC